MDKLTPEQRARLKDEDFALPGRRYPIMNRVHAANALSRVAQFGTEHEKAVVRAKVKARYPKMRHKHLT